MPEIKRAHARSKFHETTETMFLLTSAFQKLAFCGGRSIRCREAVVSSKGGEPIDPQSGERGISVSDEPEQAGFIIVITISGDSGDGSGWWFWQSGPEQGLF
ncbi:hypothetical protein [Gimesia fumaroli]|nr:hypothetical protein [Gimesia fumaroli]